MAYRRTPATQERLDGVRETILNAALTVISQGGYATVTMSAVAQAAGVATGTLYGHFPGRETLLTEAFRLATQREVDAVAASLTGGGPEATTSERISAAGRTFAKRARSNPTLAYALVAEPIDAGVQDQRLRFRWAYRDLFAVEVARGVARGELPPQDPAITGAVLVGALAEALVYPLKDGTVSDALIDQLIATLMRTLGARHASHS